MIEPPCRSFEHHRWRSVMRHVACDIDRFIASSNYLDASQATFAHRLSTFTRPELQCLFLHRIAHWLYVNRWRRTARVISRANALLHKVHLTPQSCIGPGCRLPHPCGLSFHGSAGRNLTLFSGCVCGPRTPPFDGSIERGPRLGDDVLVGGHAVVLGSVKVGDGARIGFSALVDCDVPSNVAIVSHAGRNKTKPRTPQ